MWKRILMGVAASVLAFGVQASDMGVSAQEAWDKINQKDQNVLLIDVRDPVEIMFVGSAEGVDANIPFMLADRTRFNEERGHFAFERNEDFVDLVKQELDRRGLDASTEIITMCRSGSERGEPSAKVLRDAGMPNAKFVVHGFQGDAIKEGPQAGMRLQNGWQNSDLPWTSKVNPETIYRVDR